MHDAQQSDLLLQGLKFAIHVEYMWNPSLTASKLAATLCESKGSLNMLLQFLNNKAKCFQNV